MVNPKIFKDYDIRAEVDVELDEAGVRRIGQAFASMLQPKTIAVGHDMRLTGETFAQALIEEFAQMGVNVLDLGLISTDASYYAAGTFDTDYVIMVTASHNPPRYNGMKFTKRGGESLDGKSAIYPLRDKVMSDEVFTPFAQPGQITKVPNVLHDFSLHALSLVQPETVKPLKVLIDAGNGMASAILAPILERMPQLQVEKLYFELDGSFPNHLANPLIEAGQKDARERLQSGQYDLGVLFDGDGDRMFLMDEKGNFISGSTTTAMVAKQILSQHPGELVLYNAICGREVPKVIESMGGKSQRTKVGHSLIKKDMKATNAIFAGEHSGHYFFRDFFGADSGVLAMLFALEYISADGRPVSQIVADFDKYPQSGEINFTVTDKDVIIKALEDKYGQQAKSFDYLDGITLWFDDYWANVRPSNTQPVLRLNVEANTPEILEAKTQEFRAFIESYGGKQNFE
jgi:phosphomannomutase